MTRWRIVQIQIDGSPRVVTYREDFPKVFCVPRAGKKPIWLPLSKLEVGTPIMCWTEKIVGDLDKIERVAVGIYNRAIRKKLDRLQHLGNFNRAADRISSIIWNRDLQDEFNERMWRKGCERDDPASRLSDYWSNEPDPSANDFKPYFPRDFDDVKRTARVALELDRNRRLGLAPGARSILNLVKGGSAKADLKFIRSTLLKKKWKRKQIQGWISSRISKARSRGKGKPKKAADAGEEEDRNLLIAQELNKRVARILQKKGANKLGLITALDWSDSPNGESNSRTSQTTLRFHPVTRVQRSAVSETIGLEMDDAADELARQLRSPVKVMLEHRPLTFFGGHPFPEEVSLQILPRSTYQITIATSDGLSISIDRVERKGNEFKGEISSTVTDGELNIRVTGPLGTRTFSRHIPATLLKPEEAHKGSWSRVRGKFLLHVRSASDYRLEPSPHPSYYLHLNMEASGGPGERDHEFEFIPVSDTLTIPDCRLVTPNGEFVVQGDSFPIALPKFDFSVNSSYLAKLPIPQRLLTRDALAAYVSALCKKYNQCLDMCLQSIQRVEELSASNSPELARLKDFVEKARTRQIPASYRVCLEACKMLQAIVEQVFAGKFQTRATDSSSASVETPGTPPAQEETSVHAGIQAGRT